MPQDSYPGKIKGEDDKAHYDVFARLNNIRDWPGYADQQEDRRLWLRNWLKVNCDLTDDQLQKAKPVNVCNLPQPSSEKKGANQEDAFIAEREAWWNHDDLKPGGNDGQVQAGQPRLARSSAQGRQGRALRALRQALDRDEARPAMVGLEEEPRHDHGGEEAAAGRRTGATRR